MKKSVFITKPVYNKLNKQLLFTIPKRRLKLKIVPKKIKFKIEKIWK